jgi:hypothetical protein
VKLPFIKKTNQINTFAKKVLFDAEKSAIDNRSKPSVESEAV